MLFDLFYLSLHHKNITMSTHTQILYQIVFSTKERVRVLTKDSRQELFKYIWGVIKESGCHLYRINGVEDHLHIVTHIHPTVCLADLVKDVKLSSSDMIKKKRLFNDFIEWQDGYGAFTYSFKEKDSLIDYVKNQEEHHKIITFKEDIFHCYGITALNLMKNTCCSTGIGLCNSRQVKKCSVGLNANIYVEPLQGSLMYVTFYPGFTTRGYSY